MSSANEAILSDPHTFANAENGHFWQQAAQGKFLVKSCRACTRAHWYPRPICPHCGSNDTEWVESAGNGTIYSYSVMRRGEAYAIAYVRLAEGTTMLTNIVDCDVDKLAIGQEVKVRFVTQADGLPVPMFAPVSG